MTIKHSKKRNIGLINEFFARYISKAIIEQKDSKITLAKSIIKKHLYKGTDLYEELKLFNILCKTQVSNKESAYSLINNIKEFCKTQSKERIELEKSAFLKEINCKINDVNFFNENIKEYKKYGTIQILLNGWREGVPTEHLKEFIELEENLVNYLLENKNHNNNNKVLEMTNTDIDDLVFNIMYEKLNKKFGALLNEEQKRIINYYVYSKEDNEVIKNNLISLLETIKNRTLDKINREISFTKEEYSLKQLKEVYSILLEEKNNIENLNDNKIAFYLGVLNLEKELNNNASA